MQIFNLAGKNIVLKITTDKMYKVLIFCFVVISIASCEATCGDSNQQVCVSVPTCKPAKSSCPLMTFTFPRDNQNEDYVRYRNYVPRMPQATVCGWVDTNDYTSFTSIVSYASSLLGNAYVLAIMSQTVLRVHIMKNNIHHDFTVPRLNTKFHFCHWFSSSQKRMGIYIDGISISFTNYTGEIVSGGGTMLLGQEQDAPNAGGFNANEAIKGNITNFMIWPRVLSATEIYKLASECDCPSDYSIAFKMDRVEMYGQASYSVPKDCPKV